MRCNNRQCDPPFKLLLPKETDTADFKNTIGSENATPDDESMDLSATVVNSDNIATESLDHQEQQVPINSSIVPVVPTDDLPKFDQYILDSITAAASSSSTSITSSTGYQNFNGANINTQNCNNDPHEMPQLLNILNELLDGQDISSLANSGGNGDTIQDMEDQEENYEDETMRKDDPEEMAKILAQQRAEVISREEQQLRRRMDFLIRRLFKLVARSTGIHVSEEMAGFLEHVTRYSKKKENMFKEKQMSSVKFSSYLSGSNVPSELLTSPTLSTEPPMNLLSSPMTITSVGIKTQDNDDEKSLPQTSNNNNLTVVDTLDVIEPSKSNNTELKPVPLKEMKSFLRRIDNISTMQSTVQTKKALAFKYFSKTSPSSNNLNSTSSKLESSNFSVSAIPKFEDKDVDQVEQTSGLLMSEMRLIENQIDSDATASSTGCESADEMTVYNNHYQQPLSISKRAAYKYSKDRGAVASRWSWLATQISELDYKIRQHTDLRKHIRENKGVVTLEPIKISEGQRLSATNYNIDSDSDDNEGGSCARVRPLALSLFRKRKLVQIANLHQISKKAARPSTIKCGCNWPLQPCALCTGRADPTAPRELMDVLPETERVALLDPSFHPVLSFPEDVSSSIHLEAIMNIPEWQSKMIRSSPKSIMKHATKQLEMLSGGNNGSFKDEFKLFGLAKPNAFDITEKKLKKGNIDLITGKRKYTKRFSKLDGGVVLGNKLKERKKYKKQRASLAMAQNPHVPRKYTFKKRLRKLDGLSSMHNLPPNGLNNSEKYLEAINRSKNSSPVPNNKSEKSSETRRTRNYDIDNIVIPYSVAAATRIELLSYKEIPTPKWRIITDEEEEQQLLVEEEHSMTSGEPIQEDITDDNVISIHEKALLDERKKFETYLKFPLTSRSRANRRIDSRGNESSGANTPIPDQTSPPHVGDIESIPSPLDNSVFHDTPSITALLNNINGRKERKRTTSKKDEVHDGGGGYSSGVPSRCISPETFRESIPAYEPLNFPLSDVSLHRLKRMMPTENSKPNDKLYTKSVMKDDETSQHQIKKTSLTTSIITTKHSSNTTRPVKRRKHNDSISESILIREKLPSSSLATIGKNNNLLIPRNNHTILNTIDLKGTDGAALKKLMNNNNGDLTNGDSFNDDEDEMDELDNSDSETVTGDESLFEPDDEDDIESDDYLDDDIEVNRKIFNSNNKKKNSLIATMD